MSKRQYNKVQTGSLSRRLIIIVAVAVSAALIIGAIVFLNTRTYEPPAFDVNAVAGEPIVQEELGYGVGGASDGSSFKAGLVSKWVREQDGSLPVWFTNPDGNDVYLLMRITRASDNKTIYESGLVKPGEYIEMLVPLEKLSADPIEVDAAIYSFDPENYHSMGTFHLSGTIE
ncbi:MAG: hypothetical protein IKF90_25950 [Parasporobacterium sp.]|nr:hypothetical protein [Parasporobacterium sp.]